MRPPRPSGCRGTRASSRGQSRRCDPNTSGRSGRNSRSKAALATSQCFNLAIDSKLRGCDVVAIRVEDVAAGGYTADRATVRQKKTGRPVRFELSEQTRQSVDDYLKATGKRPGEFLFTGRRGPDRNKHDNAPICPARVGVDRKCRSGPKAFRHAFTAPHKSYPDLPANWQSQGRPASSRTYQDRKHGQISRHRSR
jgi:integrase